ncbi:ribokinase [Acidiphilium sp. PA]|uniref:ribokinase n=1 Tax=Acidiphilium sp. PA TaxID=2871705 RepID=UPI002244E1BC|nr:ribokinase [Acidiphilium sp. PA]MCW8307787.1 ribokinase [Acidiphilium sp. PA]
MIVLGSANMDIVARAEHAPAAGETVLGRDYALYPGGKGANQAVAARRAGAAITFIGSLGQDAYGEALLHALTAEAIDCGATIRTATPTGIAIITVEAGGENRIIVIPGANHDLTADRLPPTMPPATILLTQLEIPIPTVLAAAARVRATGGTTILNASPIAGIDAATSTRLCAAADILLVNETEAAALLGLPRLNDTAGAAARLATGRRAAVITLGADGVAWASEQGTFALKRHDVPVVDTTGCGDAFAGGFAGALERGATLADAVAFGNAAGALAATKPGAQPAMPTHAEINALLST